MTRRELFGLARVRGEPQAQRVHAPHVLAVERLERGVVALLRLPDEVGHTWIRCRRVRIG